jgi:geranylgeranyl pyrophosphate synthase
VSALGALREAPGLTAFLDELEVRLAEVAGRGEGVVAEIGGTAVASGGKRLRPVLCFLAAPPGTPPPFAAAVAVELLHTATLVHDDVLDGADLRRGRASAWASHGAAAAVAGGDFLFARAFVELAATGDGDGVRILADAAVDLARGEAMQRRQLHDPDTPVEAYLERCRLKTARLFEAACLIPSRDGRLGAFGLALGVAFQLADDILDCTGTTIETGKVAGTDLRDGTPTLPLILAAREDPVVRAALAGGPLEGALARVAATGALEQSRALALEHARRARELLAGVPRADELEALTHLVVDRDA